MSIKKSSSPGGLSLGFIIILALNPAESLADWRLLGPYGGEAEFVRLSESQPDTLVAGTRRGMIFRSADRQRFEIQIAGHAGKICPQFRGLTNSWKAFFGREDNVKQVGGIGVAHMVTIWEWRCKVCDAGYVRG